MLYYLCYPASSILPQDFREGDQFEGEDFRLVFDWGLFDFGFRGDGLGIPSQEYDWC